MIRAVIFDRDGVLTWFDVATATAFFAPLLPLSVPEIARRWQDWGTAHGFPQDTAEEVRFFHSFWQQLSDELALEAHVRSSLLSFNYTSIIRAYPDARPALEMARQCGLRVGVLSNFSLASLEPSLEAAGLLDLVDVAAAAPVIGVSKPDPQAYRWIVDALAVAPEECLFFDDEEPCVAGATSAGLQAYRVDRKNPQDVPRRVVQDLSVLSTLLGGDA